METGQTLKVPGIRDPRPEPSELGHGLPSGMVREKGSALVQSARAGGAPVTFDGVQADDIVEIELQDGLKIWTRVESLSKDLERGAQRGAGEGDGSIRVPSELTIGRAS